MTKLILDDKGIVIPCARCGRKNRLPYARLSDSGTCGQCQAELTLPTVPLDVPSEAVFEAMVAESALPVVVDFWAPWCGPCRIVAPELEKVAAAQAGIWLVVKINTEALPGLGARHNIRSIPTMALFQAGQEVARTSGARPAAAIETWVRASSM